MPALRPGGGWAGTRGALSRPMLLPGRGVGAIHVDARGKNVFDDHAQGRGKLFAAPAAVAVHNAHTLSQAIALTAQLQTALAARPVIDQDIGIARR